MKLENHRILGGALIYLSLLCVAVFADGSTSNVSCPSKPNVLSAHGSYSNKLNKAEYDYIVVGGGSTGAVIASRLSEDPNVSVLLLEAGGFPPDMTEIPQYWGYIPTAGIDKLYRSEPQKNCCLSDPEKKATWDHAITLGGCSSHNGMIYNRGCPKIYDDWAANGATGWDWKSVLTYFKKSENNTDPSKLSAGYHGSGGPLTVSSPSYPDKVRDSLMDAGKSLGYNNNEDYNGASQLGQSRVQYTIRDGLRCSTEKAFLRPAGCRPNLDVLLNAFVVKIEFDDNKKANGVVFELNNATQTVAAKGEIIISAGVLASPKILMLSGIGPKDDLTKLNIKVVSDLPVGKNLQDQMMLLGMNYMLNDSVKVVFDQNATSKQILDVMFEGTGPLSYSLGAEYVNLANTKHQDPKLNCPDVNFYTISNANLLFKNTENNSISIVPIMVQPQSRGDLKLRSVNPHDDVIFDPKYLSETLDILRAVAAIEMTQKMMATPNMQQFGPQRYPKYIPGCPNNTNEDTDEWRTCFVRSMAGPALHSAGSCRMGDPKSSTTVVDPQLRVLGVSGLRVADASIMPIVATGPINAACIMIGEKAADMIKASRS